jgi:hypothetical protein
MKTLSNFSQLTASSNRPVTIAVTGILGQHTSNRTMVVPFDRLSRSIQQIQRSGGRILSVSCGSAPAAPAQPEHEAEQSAKKKKR